MTDSHPTDAHPPVADFPPDWRAFATARARFFRALAADPAPPTEARRAGAAGAPRATPAVAAPGAGDLP